MSNGFQLISSETIDSGAGSTLSSVAPSGVTEVRLDPGGVNWVAVGTAPDATSGGMRITAINEPVFLFIKPGWRVSTHSPDHDTDLNITFLTRAPIAA